MLVNTLVKFDKILEIQHLIKGDIECSIELNEDNITYLIDTIGEGFLYEFFRKLKPNEYAKYEKVLGVNNFWYLHQLHIGIMIILKNHINNGFDMSKIITDENYKIVDKYIDNMYKIQWYNLLLRLNKLEVDFDTFLIDVKNSKLHNIKPIRQLLVKDLFNHFGYDLKTSLDFSNTKSVENLLHAFYPTIELLGSLDINTTFYIIPKNCQLLNDIKNKINEIL